MLHFLRPYWLLLLLPASLYLIWLFYSYRQNNPWKQVCDPHLLPAVVEFNPSRQQRYWVLLLFAFYLISILALSGPAFKKTALPVYREVGSQMIVLDLSTNMNATDLQPNRLTRAKYKIRDLISAAQNLQMGLVVFTQEAFTASPLSNDANTLNALLDELNPGMMPVFGSDSGEGLTQAYQLLSQAGASHGTVLLITASNPSAASFRAAQTIARNGGHLNVWAMVGDTATNQALQQNLQQLAKAGSGSYYQFTADASDVKAI